MKIFEEKSIFLAEAAIIKPPSNKIDYDQENLIKENENSFKIELIENQRILNPKLDRELRQKNMRKWLMPFGFIAGLTFANMTDLSTFSFLGLNNLGESIMGGFLGMGSGYLGSIVSSASINMNRYKELRSVINLNKEGNWLLLLENEVGYELPWILIREIGAKDIIFLEN